MRRLCTAVLAVATLLLPTLSPAAMLASQFGRRYGALEIFDPQSKLSFRVNMPRLSEPLPPCSTYLIPHFAIALGTGVIKDSDSRIAFDPAKYPDSANWPTSWKRDQTLESALKDSVQWYAQELSTRMGSARLQQNLKRIKYGNADTSGGLDKFWMSSSLRVTSFQQLDFLSLQGATIGGFGLGKACMCNGANFGYAKKLFHHIIAMFIDVSTNPCRMIRDRIDHFSICFGKGIVVLEKIAVPVHMGHHQFLIYHRI